MACKLIFAMTLASMSLFLGNAHAASTVDGITSTLTMTAEPFEGECSGTRFTFQGAITVTGAIDPVEPVQIGYQFLRSDDDTEGVAASSSTSYYTVAAPGTQSVNSPAWDILVDPAHPLFNGWMQLKAWPTRHEGGFDYSFSDRVSVTVSCVEQ